MADGELTPATGLSLRGIEASTTVSLGAYIAARSPTSLPLPVLTVESLTSSSIVSLHLSRETARVTTRGDGSGDPV